MVEDMSNALRVAYREFAFNRPGKDRARNGSGQLEKGAYLFAMRVLGDQNPRVMTFAQLNMALKDIKAVPSLKKAYDLSRKLIGQRVETEGGELYFEKVEGEKGKVAVGYSPYD